MSTDFQHPGINLAHAGDDDHRHAELTVFGFWAFLMSDAIIFALLFATYAAMATRTNGGPTGAQIFQLSNVFIETLVLLLSSFAFGLASVALKEGRVRAIYLWMAISLLLGLGFLGLELRELTGLIASGAAPQASGFLSSFFLLVSTHGLHVLAGSIWIVVMLVQIAVLGLRREVPSRLLRLGLFWHFLDLIWIVIFSWSICPEWPHDAPQTGTNTPQPAADAARERRAYVWGFGLAILLTAASFGLVAYTNLPPVLLLPALGVLALAQIVVHFAFFLHIDLSRSKREDLQLILFTSLLILIMVGGSLWILYNLDQRMMSYGPRPAPATAEI